MVEALRVRLMQTRWFFWRLLRGKRVLWSNAITRRVVVELLYEPRDWWIGVFIDERESRMQERWHMVYVCVVPCLPVRIAWYAGQR